MPGTNLTDARIGALKPRKPADDSRDVRGWFASPHATPVVADRSMPVLSVIVREDAGGRLGATLRAALSGRDTGEKCGLVSCFRNY